MFALKGCRASRVVSLAALALPFLIAGQSGADEVEPSKEAARPVSEIRRELIEWRKVLDDRDAASAPARKEAAERIEGIDDPRAVAVLGELWEKEKLAKGSAHRRHYVQALMNIGDHKAFLKLVEISVEDPDFGIRHRAASWIGAQDNRDDAIPIFVRYLRSAKLYKSALTSLGYTEIAKKSSPPDPALVAALIDNLFTVTPVRKRASVVYDTGWQQRGLRHYSREQRTVRGWVTEYEKSENPDVKQFLYDYTHQDLGYDQGLWRKTLLKPASVAAGRQ